MASGKMSALRSLPIALATFVRGAVLLTTQMMGRILLWIAPLVMAVAEAVKGGFE